MKNSEYRMKKIPESSLFCIRHSLFNTCLARYGHPGYPTDMQSDPADRFLAATAAVYDLHLVTADDRLRAGSGYRVFA